MGEGTLQSHIMVAQSQEGARVFRNNVGRFMDAVGRWVRFGLCVGSSDLIGWKSITITQEMVGKKVAVFLATEVKLPNGKLTKQQEQFLSVVRQAGGIAICARSVEQSVEGLNGYRPV